MNCTTADVAPREVREAVQRILVSSDFDASARNRRFLRFIVEEALAGRGSRIKAYTIATSVFGRDDDFDAQLDPIVRIEARRLRRSLERFYLMAGRTEPIRISIPKGGYVPVFTVTASDVESGSRRPAIFVAALEEEGDCSDLPNFTRGFTRQLIVALTRFNDLQVFGPETSFEYGERPDRATLRNELGVDFLLSGGTELVAGRFAVHALLSDLRSGRTLWAQGFERPLRPDEFFEVRDHVANKVAQAVAQPYGMIHSSKVRDAEGKAPQALTAYECVLRFYTYWRTHAREAFEDVRVALEKAISTDPNYAEAHACLALVYVDAARFSFDAGPFAAAPLRRALDLAARAIELAPRSSRAHHAQGLTHWFDGAVRDAVQALETGLSLNPNDTEVMAELGLRLALRADWDRARPLLQRSFEQNPAQPSAYRVGLALDHYAHGRFADAFAEARRVNAPNVLYGHVLLAIAAAKCDAQTEATSAIASILEIDPDYGAHVVADLTGRKVEPGLVRVIVEGLGVAGLPQIRNAVEQPKLLRSL